MKTFAADKKLLTWERQISTVVNAVSEVTLSPLDWGRKSLMRKSERESSIKNKHEQHYLSLIAFFLERDENSSHV